jgi:hypothetical protein
MRTRFPMLMGVCRQIIDNHVIWSKRADEAREH